MLRELNGTRTDSIVQHKSKSSDFGSKERTEALRY